MKSLDETITEALAEFQRRQSYRGKELSPTDIGALRALLVTSVQRNVEEFVASLEETVDTDDDIETLQRALNIIKHLIVHYSIDDSVTINQEQLWRVEDLFLVIDHEPMGITKLTVTSKPPSDNE